MLVLTRKVDERIFLGDGITITVVRIAGDKVRLGIDAPPDVQVVRDNAVAAEPRPHGKLTEPGAPV